MAPQFDRALAGFAARRRLHAGPARARQPRNLAQPDHAAKLRRADRHSQPPHRQRHFAAGGIAEGVLSQPERRAWSDRPYWGAVLTVTTSFTPPRRPSAAQ